MSVCGGATCVCAPDNTNIALRRPTSMSSLYHGAYPAGNAVDGQPNNFFHTQSGDHNPWWRVDFELGSIVSRVIIYNRVDCCRERLDNSVVSLLDSQGNSVWSAKINRGSGFEYNFNVNPPVSAASLKVSKNTQWLHLSEVIVIGC